jgi:hypothetical protein
MKVGEDDPMIHQLSFHISIFFLFMAEIYVVL